MRGDLPLVRSEPVLRELEAAPQRVKTVVETVPEANIEPVSLVPEAEELVAT